MGQAIIRHGGMVHRLRCDPNDVSWNYTLNTRVEETYGGRVVQLLSVKIQNLTIQADSGSGRWEYLYSLVSFCRDVLFQQKMTGEPAVFEYPPRGWVLKGYLVNVPYTDNWQNVKYPFTLNFKIQEDVSGIMSGDTMGSELNKIRDGIGYEKNDYNYPLEAETESAADLPEEERKEADKERPKDSSGKPIAGPYRASDGTWK